MRRFVYGVIWRETVDDGVLRGTIALVEPEEEFLVPCRCVAHKRTGKHFGSVLALFGSRQEANSWRKAHDLIPDTRVKKLGLVRVLEL